MVLPRYENWIVRSLPAKQRVGGWMISLCLVGWAVSLSANPPVPQLKRIFPGGCQVGESLLVKVSGSSLEGLSAARSSHPGVVFQHREKDQFQVTVAPGTPTGSYDVQVITNHGVSSTRAFYVTGRPLVAEKRVVDQDSSDKIKVHVNDVISGEIASSGEVDEYSLALEAGQDLVVECWSHRLDSSLRAILELVDGRGQRVASSRGLFGVDPAFVYRVHRGGEYRVRIHDLVYGGSSDHFYRLDVGSGPRVVFCHPMVLQRGKKTRVTLYGWNLAEPAAGNSPGAYSSQVVEVTPPENNRMSTGYRPPATVAVDSFSYHVPGIDTPLLLGLTDIPVVLDTSDNHTAEVAQHMAVPSEVSGQLTEGNERDWYRFTARRGEVFYVEGFGQRLGSPVDLDISIMDQAGKQELAHYRDELANIGGLRFPSSHLDPSGRWVAPADGDYLIVVRNLVGDLQGDLRRTYRLSVRREESQVRLVAVARPKSSPGGINVPRGGRQLIDVMAFRQRGQDASIRVAARNLPAGVTCPDIWLGPGVTQAPLVLTAAEGAEGTITNLQLFGHYSWGGLAVTRPVQGGTMVRTGLPNGAGRLTQEIPFAVAGAVPVLVTATANKKTYQQGSIVDVAIDVQRQGLQQETVVRLSGVGLPAQVRQQRAVIAAGQSKGNISFYLPPTLPAGNYSLVVQAETTVLADAAKDSKPVAMTLFTNAINFEVYPAPFVMAVDLDAPRKISRGEVVQVKYTAVRKNGFIGKIHTDVRAAGGLVGLRVRGVTFVGQTESGTLQIIANEDAPLGQQPFLRLEGVGTVEDEPVYLGACFLRLEIVE